MRKAGLEKIINPDLKETLETTKHGSEIVKHFREGDECFRNNLLHPALSSYIHALEWTLITRLEIEGKDVIEEEENGNFYHFAGGRSNLLDSVKNCKGIQIDQKTTSFIESLNKAQRRWMAHHKTGETLPTDVKSIRGRLKWLLSKWFKDGKEI